MFKVGDEVLYKPYGHFYKGIVKEIIDDITIRVEFKAYKHPGYKEGYSFGISVYYTNTLLPFVEKSKEEKVLDMIHYLDSKYQKRLEIKRSLYVQT